MKEIRTEIEISASRENLWNILLDFPRYPAWNPFIKEADGDIKPGGKLKIRIDLPEGGKMTFRPRVKTLKENSELSWLGRFLVPGLFDGEHHFEIIGLNNGTVKFVQWEKFSGILVPLFWKSMGPKTRKGFEMMNEAIKKFAEKR